MICDPPVKGRYLTVHLPGVPSSSGSIEICELFVYDHPGKNIVIIEEYKKRNYVKKESYDFKTF